MLEVTRDKDNKMKVLDYLFKPKPNTQMSFEDPYNYVDKMLENWINHFKGFSTLWLDNPDLRLTQVLVNTGIIPNFSGFWYNVEDEEIMINSNILQPREIKFWGQNYDKDMKKLPETNWVLLKDLNTGHIENILLDVLNDKMKISEEYSKYFSEELKIRQDGKN